ncbi:MAG: hypothetical protein E6Q93_02420 [Burkholderiaceae bacterium]|jgi:hypothetical protein|nr:MAG: hypothetical protein E6Q93_02420 [Burkholderiaceae bacterium]
MSPSSLRPKPRRTSVATEEERAWISFYQRVGQDATLAAEVLAQLEADVEMKRMHLALYLSCRESLRSHAVREQRNARIGRFVRRMLHGLFVVMPRTVGRKLKRGGDIAVACLPEADAEPALAQVRRLASDPELRAARGAFEPASGGTAVASAAAGCPKVRAAE